MENLPDDILRNIFIRLQAKQIGQLRCVSKPMSVLLCQPSFTKSHLDRSTHDNDDETFMVFESPFYFNDDTTPLPCQSPKFPPSKESRCYVVNGSVNGLICFFSCGTSNVNHVFYIWNPSLSALLHLPPPTIPSRGFSVLFRFGYDPKTDDYKVVKLSSIKGVRIDHWIHARIYSFKQCLQAEVYSMRKGYWESITQKFPSHVSRIYDHSEICEDGRHGYVHWLGDLGYAKLLQTIVAFDLGSETFNEISLPHSIQDYSENYSCLGYLYGKLCVMSKNRDFDCEVWIMDEYGVAESWVKRHVFPQHVGILRPFGFILDDVFLFEDHNHYLGLYHLSVPEVKSIYIKAWSVIFSSTKIVPYVDSLVWVAPTKRGN